MFPPLPTPSTKSPSPNLPPARSNDLDDLEQCLRSQIARIAQSLERVGGAPTSQTVGVTHVPHAAGPRKPSLAQLEMEGYPFRQSCQLWRHR